MSNYVRSLAAFVTSGGIVNSDRLHDEVAAKAAITVVLDAIDIGPSAVTFRFRASLAPSEETALDEVVATHSGQAPADRQPPMIVAQVKPEAATEVWFATPNFCDKTTWYGRSLRVTGEVLQVVDPDRTQFKTQRTFLIDLIHGKLPDEDSFSAPHILRVYVDGVPKTEDVPLAWDDGERDFICDYRSGIVTFHEPVAPGAVVTADYSWATTSLHRIAPHHGKRIMLQSAEAEFTTDVDMRDTVIYSGAVPAIVAATAAGVDVATIQAMLVAECGSLEKLNRLLGKMTTDGKGTSDPLAPTDVVPFGERRVYKTYWDFRSQSNGNYAEVPAIGGPLRGVRSASITHPFDYRGAKEISSVLGAEVWVWLKDHIEFGGGETARSTATFYTLIEDA